LIVYFSSIQVEGKGNGIKTVIVNMVDVAKALSRPPTCKYSVSSSYELKQSVQWRCICIQK